MSLVKKKKSNKNSRIESVNTRATKKLTQKLYQNVENSGIDKPKKMWYDKDDKKMSCNLCRGYTTDITVFRRKTPKYL